MTKFCQWCMHQCQHEKTQFCTVPSSPANATKKGLLAVWSTKVPRESILAGNWEVKVNFFLCLVWNDGHYAPLCTAFSSMQFLCMGYFSVLATPLKSGIKKYHDLDQLEWTRGMDPPRNGCKNPCKCVSWCGQCVWYVEGHEIGSFPGFNMVDITLKDNKVIFGWNRRLQQNIICIKYTFRKFSICQIINVYKEQKRAKDWALGYPWQDW